MGKPQLPKQVRGSGKPNGGGPRFVLIDLVGTRLKRRQLLVQPKHASRSSHSRLQIERPSLWRRPLYISQPSKLTNTLQIFLAFRSGDSLLQPRIPVRELDYVRGDFEMQRPSPASVEALSVSSRSRENISRRNKSIVLWGQTGMRT